MNIVNPGHLRHKAGTLNIQPELPVKYPGVAPALRHVDYELPAIGVLTDIVGNDLALEIDRVDREHVEEGEDKLKEEQAEDDYNSECSKCSISFLQIIAEDLI